MALFVVYRPSGIPVQVFLKEMSAEEPCRVIAADPIYSELIANLVHLRLRDPDGTPDSTFQVKWMSPDKARTALYDQFILVTHFTIPVADIGSHSEEAIFIVSKLEAFGAVFKTVLVSPQFVDFHKAACPRDTIWKSMNGQGPNNGGLSFANYCIDAGVRASPADNLNAFIVFSDVAPLMDVLWKGRNPAGGRKYAK